MSTVDSEGPAGSPDVPGLELPKYGVLAQGKDLYLTIQYHTSQAMYYLANIGNYEEVARKLHKGLMDAGRDAKREARGTKLHVASGAEVDRVVHESERRKPRS